MKFGFAFRCLVERGGNDQDRSGSRDADGKSDQVVGTGHDEFEAERAKRVFGGSFWATRDLLRSDGGIGFERSLSTPLLLGMNRAMLELAFTRWRLQTGSQSRFLARFWRGEFIRRAVVDESADLPTSATQQ